MTFAAAYSIARCAPVGALGAWGEVVHEEEEEQEQVKAWPALGGR